MKKKLLCYTFPLLLLVSHLHAADTTIVKSPDGLIVFKLFPRQERLWYSITYNNQPVIEASALAMSVDGVDITTQAAKGSNKATVINERYPLLGVHSMADNHCRAVTVNFTHNTLSYRLETRVFNDGAAFRIIVPGKGSDQRIPDEATVFNIPRGSHIWYHDMEMHYEGIHVKKEIGAVQNGEWLAPPATFRLPQGIYAAITEASLVNYSGMALQANGNNGLVVRLAHKQPTSYPYRLRYSPEDTLRLLQPAAVSGAITTPWRVVIIGKDLNAMVNNDIVYNLNPPPDKKYFPDGVHTSWIKPGRAVWKYLDGGGSGTPEVMKAFTDDAAALGFEHNILEGFWARWPEEQLKELIDYSRKKNVGIWLWKHSKSLRDDSERLAFFKRCHELGVTGLKIDFFDHEAKEVIDLYESIHREAAQYKLLLDFHGANKPTGWARTWPNELTPESVKGMESSKLTDRATHETTIPFTRFLAGPGEYTVLHFGERRKNTTWAHQVASAAILSAPLLTYAAHPDAILSNPAVEVIKNIPAVWDETIVLPGSEIGELAVYARRKGSTWFLAVMNGNQPRQVKIPLQFLDGKYNAITVNDDPAKSDAVIIKQQSYSKAGTIELDLAAGGGFVAQFTK